MEPKRNDYRLTADGLTVLSNSMLDTYRPERVAWCDLICNKCGCYHWGPVNIYLGTQCFRLINAEEINHDIKKLLTAAAKFCRGVLRVPSGREVKSSLLPVVELMSSGVIIEDGGTP